MRSGSDSIFTAVRQVRPAEPARRRPLVAIDQAALQLAVGAEAEYVERVPQEAEFGEQAEHAHHPGAKGASSDGPAHRRCG
jgi:hypothetical protein